MASCRVIRDNLTAWIDGELSSRWDDRVRTHLAACAACTTEADGLRQSIELQHRMLSQVTILPGFDPAPAWTRVQRALRAAARDTQDTADAPGSWMAVLRGWFGHPLALAGAAMAVGLILLLAVAGGPKAVLIPLGVAPPPVAVTSHPDLFKDYSLIQHLDALENFDTVESEPLDDDQASFNG
jgi:anti-sigma factor RsiW